MRRRINRVERIALSGGLIGMLATNPRHALESALVKANAEGWSCRQILPHRTTNLLALLLQLAILACTLGLWTFGAGYLILLEREEEAG